jgi:hypothetical protein
MYCDQLLVRSPKESGALETQGLSLAKLWHGPLSDRAREKKVKLQRLPRSGIETCVVRE